MQIRPYQKDIDKDGIVKLIKSEGEDWACYSADEVLVKYMSALESAITYVAYEGNVLCGYSRSLDDCGFYIYVCDLLIMAEYRGRNIGQKLMEIIYRDYPDRIVYVMSGADGYYQKLGYNKVGSIFQVSNPSGK